MFPSIVDRRRARRRLLFRSVRLLTRWSGFERARRIGGWLGELQYRLNGRTRRRCIEDLARLQHRTSDDPRIARQLREAYRNYSSATFEVIAMFNRRVDAATLRARCRIDGIERLETARQGHGAILLVTHSGNSLLLAVQLAGAGWPMTVVYRQARMMPVEFFIDGLAMYGIEGIRANEGRGAYAAMRRALRSDRVVFVMMDQGVKTAKDGVVMRFLGKDMPMPAGPAHLARRTGAPVLPVLTLAAEPAWHFSIEPPVPLPPDNTLEEDVEALLRVCERQVLERPQLWSWAHRRWRKYPLARASD